MSSWSSLPVGLLEEEVVAWLPCADLPALASMCLSVRHLAADAVWQARFDGLPKGLLDQVPLGRTDQTSRPSAFRRRTAALEARAGLTIEQRGRLDYELCVSCYDGSSCWPLLRQGASVLCAVGGQTPLNHAAAGGNVAPIRALLASGAPLRKPRASGEAALHLAVLHGHACAVRALVAAGADMEEVDCQGDTALLAAAAAGNAGMVQVLIESGADMETTDLDGDTPLICAIVNGQLSVVQLLLDHGVDCEGGGREDEETPLMRAASEGNAAIVRALLLAGADVRATQRDGNTALLSAVVGGCAASVEALVSHGADLEARGPDGATALAHALSKGHREVARILALAGVEGAAPPSSITTVAVARFAHEAGCEAQVPV